MGRFILIFCFSVLLLAGFGLQEINSASFTHFIDTTQSKGELSFRTDGKIWQSQPDQSKCWTSHSVKTTLLQARGDRFKVDWQIQEMNRTGSYRIDSLEKGRISFVLNGRSYQLGNHKSGTYLLIHITAVQDLFNIRLLSGTFEGVLQDHEGKRLRISEGKFSSNRI